MTALSWSLDTCGPLARTVEDTAVVLETIAGADPRDPSTTRRPVERYAARLNGDVRGLRIGVPREHYWDPIDPEVASAVRASIQRLAELGASVEEVSIPWVQHAFAPANIISWVESVAYHSTWQDRWASDYGEEMQLRMLIGRAVSGADYLRAQQARTGHCRPRPGALRANRPARDADQPGAGPADLRRHRQGRLGARAGSIGDGPALSTRQSDRLPGGGGPLRVQPGRSADQSASDGGALW